MTYQQASDSCSWGGRPADQWVQKLGSTDCGSLNHEFSQMEENED
jgi:hypothetical protein